MGGQEGSRGYLYQAFASILEAIEYKYWNNIFVEFKTENDKVDIALELDSKIVKTIQVKSSINLFGKNDITKWISELINDFTSEEYELYLIGSCDKSANTLIKSLKKHFDGVKDKESEATLKDLESDLLNNKVSIKVIPFEVKTLESIVRDSLNRYISKKGGVVEYEGLDLIAKGVGLTFMLLSTSGKAISKEEFDKKIFTWLSNTLGSYLKKNRSKSMHEVLVYNKSTQQILQESSEIKLHNYYGYNAYVKERKDELLKLIYIIQVIDLPAFSPTKNESGKVDLEYTNSEEIEVEEAHTRVDLDNDLLSWVKNVGNSFVNQTKYKSLEIDDEKKQEYINSIKELIGIELSEEFFYVGNLKQMQTLDFVHQSKKEILGTEDEKRKYGYLEEFEYKLLELDLLKIFIEEFKNCTFVPFVISNISDEPDHNLKIKIFIPKKVQIFKSQDYLENDLIKELPGFCADTDGVIDKLFKLKSDSIVTVEEGSNQLDYRSLKVPMPYFLGRTYDDGYTIDDFYKVLEQNIGQTVYEDDKDYNVLEYHIDSLYPREIKALQNVLVVRSIESDVAIKFKVLSSNSDGTLEGELHIKKRLSDNI